MKTLIIILLSVALLAGAFLSRPSEDDFKAMLANKQAGHDKELVQKVLEQLMQKGGTVDGYVYKDRFLWVTVEKNGKTAYTGVFGTWFGHGEG